MIINYWFQNTRRQLPNVGVQDDARRVLNARIWLCQMNDQSPIAKTKLQSNYGAIAWAVARRCTKRIKQQLLKTSYQLAESL